MAIPKPSAATASAEENRAPQLSREISTEGTGYVWIMSRGERNEGSAVVEVFADPALALDEFAAEAKRQGFPRAEKVRVMFEFHLFERGVDYLELRRHSVRRRAPRPGRAAQD
ncbi:hypothetical protein [Streptomyces anulatus]|uniref:hypothetical protein n=1 Tax=Streptomyces anulatus TaxID=1892 RepID=UPI001C27CCB6|nr:hypothetical protein [Streptomyces anulatus]